MRASPAFSRLSKYSPPRRDKAPEVAVTPGAQGKGCSHQSLLISAPTYLPLQKKALRAGCPRCRRIAHAPGPAVPFLMRRGGASPQGPRVGALQVRMHPVNPEIRFRWAIPAGPVNGGHDDMPNSSIAKGQGRGAGTQRGRVFTRTRKRAKPVTVWRLVGFSSDRQ